MEIKLAVSGKQKQKLKSKQQAATARAVMLPENLKRVVILRCGIVRLQNYSENLSEPGRQLRLVREPENQYDRWAIRVCTPSGTMLGYLPARKNQSAARLMDAGKKITVFVDESSATAEPNYFSRSREDERLPLILYMDVCKGENGHDPESRPEE